MMVRPKGVVPSSATNRFKVMRLIARMNVGGPAIQTSLLTEKLDPQRFESLLVTGVEAEGEGNMLELMGSAVQPLIVPSLGREISLRSDFRTLRAVLRLMQRHRPYIVHTHTAKAGFIGRLAARLARVPIVVHTFHGNVFKGYFSPAKTRLFIALERWLARGTDRIIVLSEQQKQEILSLGIGRPEQFRIVPLGLDLSRFARELPPRGAIRRELGVDESTPLIGIVARLVPIKAIHLLLEAAPAILKQYPQALFLLIGDGESRDELDQLAHRLKIEKSVRFLGFRADLPQLYADLDCAVLCSLNEGLPVAIIEALASARPVVATDVGSVANLVQLGRTGVLVPPGEPQPLAEGILQVLDNPEQAAQWGRNGREHVYPALDIQRLVNDIEALYLNLLREKKLLQ